MSEHRSAEAEALRPSGKRQVTGTASVSKSSARSAQGPDVVGGNGNIFARIVDYFRGVNSEMRKVIWPTWRQMGTYTGVVLAFLIIMVALVAGVDFLAGKGVEFVLTR